LNRAHNIICSVKWAFLRGNDELRLTDGVILYDLVPAVRTLKEDDIIIDVVSEIRNLMPSTPEMILNHTRRTAMSGKPTRYCLHGLNGATQRILIGAPTSNSDAYIVRYAYWQNPDAYTAAETPLISAVYGDDPLISGALWAYWKALEQNAKATDALIEFVGDMKVMQSQFAYDGPGIEEILAQAGAQA
jgi:hypothetical protein